MVNRLEYVAILRDNASPALRRLSATARNLNEAFSGAQTVGREFTRTLSAGITSIQNGFNQLRDAINDLFRLRLIAGLIAGIFGFITGAVNAAIRAVSLTLDGLSFGFRVVTQAVRAYIAVVQVLAPALGEIISFTARWIIRLIRLAVILQLNFAIRVPRFIRNLRLFNFGINSAVRAGALLTAGLETLRGHYALIAVNVRTALIAILALVVGVNLLVTHWDDLTRSFRQLIAGIPTLDRLLDRLEDAFFRLGVLLGEITARIIPAFVRGLLTRAFTALRRLAGFIVDVVIKAFQFLRAEFNKLAGEDGVATVIESTEKLSASVAEATGGTERFRREAVRVTGAAAQLGERHLPRLIRGFNELVAPITRAFRAVQRFSNLALETAVGQVQIAGVAIVTFFAAAASAANTGAAPAASALANGINRIETAGIEALLRLQERLPSPIRPFFGRLIADITDRELNAQLTEAVSALGIALSNPINLTAFLNEGVITEELQGAIDAYSEAQEEIVRIREAVLRRLGFLEETQEERLARIRQQATRQQLQSFLQSAGQLVQGRQDLAIALATIDAGLAISGAFAHGAQYGPGYLAAYVATVAANLANTINSIRSFSVPSAVGAISTPDTGVPEPGRPSVSPEVTVNVIGDRFSAQTVRDAVDESVRIATGQLSA